MKSLLLVLVLASVGLAGMAQAQCNPDPNEIGIFWDQDCANCQNCLNYIGGMVSAYVILINCTQPAGILGFEFQLTNADGSDFLPPLSTFIVDYQLPPTAINIDAGPRFIVGLGVPLPQSPCMTLVSITMLVLDASAWCFGVKPVDIPSIPGQMVIADGADPGLLLPIYPNTGPDATDYQMACLNSPDCPPGPVAIEESSWGSLKSLYR